jgi:hypothetical protein
MPGINEAASQSQLFGTTRPYLSRIAVDASTIKTQFPGMSTLYHAHFYHDHWPISSTEPLPYVVIFPHAPMPQHAPDHCHICTAVHAGMSYTQSIQSCAYGLKHWWAVERTILIKYTYSHVFH